MEQKPAGGAIRLTNKTAIALRESARTVRRTGVVVGAAVTVAFAVAAVWCGMRWLPAVPLLIGAAVAIDALIALHARQTYLLLTGQAICTEAAARGIRGEADARQRRKQALSDLAEIQKDVEKAVGRREEEEQELFPPLSQTRRISAVKPPEETKPTAHRRRRQAVFTVIQSDKQVQ